MQPQVNHKNCDTMTKTLLTGLTIILLTGIQFFWSVIYCVCYKENSFSLRTLFTLLDFDF